MRKILISLLAIGSFSVAFANYLPNGNYAGALTSSKGTIDSADSSKTTIINDQANVVIPKLTDITATDGVLSGSIANMGQGDVDCFSGSARFSAKKFGVPVSASNVKITNCVFNPSNNTFTGNFSANVPIVGTQTGTFAFTLQ